MKKLVLFILLAGFVSPQIFGQCQPNEIELVKSGQRDWVKNFDNLVKKFGNNQQTNSLRSYFYQNNQRRNCISRTNLQLLQSELERAFPMSKYQNEAIVRDFSAAVKTIAVSNLPSPESTLIVQETPVLTTDEIIKVETIELPPYYRTELEQLKSSKMIWMIAALLAGISAVGLGMFYFFQTKKMKQTIKRQTHQMLKLGNAQHESGKNDTVRELGFKTDAQKWKEKYSASDRELRQVTDEFAKYKEQMQAASQKKVGNVSKTTATPAVIPESERTVFFLSLPTATEDGMGSFRDMRQGQPNPTSSYYKFAENTDGKTAKFWFLENQNTLQSALIYPDTYINPACEYQSFNSTAKTIKTSEPGLAEKQGENWKVIRKAKIKFV
jgi:hypothetical protein